MGDGPVIDQRRPILFIDALNLFCRAYFAYPQMSVTTGQQIGGCVGFLKTMARICRETSPSFVVVAWEGGGSSRRRALFDDYKKGRRADQPNRHEADRELPETDDNRVAQIKALTKILKTIPVCQVYAPDCEGDDVIAYLVKGRFSANRKIIVTSDKDFFQLIDERTTVFSLHKKTYVTQESLFDEFRVSPANFGLAKAICGDPSDNIDGVPGVGFRTLSRVFPFLGSDQHSIILSDIMDYCASHADESRVCRDVLAARSLVERNMQLVQLGAFSLTAEQVKRVEYTLDTFHPVANRMALIRCLITEGIADFDVDDMLFSFVGIESVNSTES